MENLTAGDRLVIVFALVMGMCAGTVAGLCLFIWEQSTTRYVGRKGGHMMTRISGYCVTRAMMRKPSVSSGEVLGVGRCGVASTQGATPVT